MAQADAQAQATFCATLVDEWIGRGVRWAVVAPGSRSTPMALALDSRAELGLHVVHDERAAAFVALGRGLDGMPAVLLCTSGTAAANFLPAVVEAGLSDVPLIVVTADRPPESRGVGAPQTIDQTHLYGRAVRWFHDPGVPDAALAPTWRSLAGRVFEAASDGPVHLNVPFREPLVGSVGVLPAARHRRVEAVAGRPALDALGFDGQRGVILAGGRSGVGPADVAALAAGARWPVLADPTSGMRQLDGAIASFDALLRDPGFAAAHRPDVIVRVGRPAASKVLAQWTATAAAAGAVVVQVGGPGTIDPDHDVTTRLAAAQLAGVTPPDPSDPAWLAEWIEAAGLAEAAIDDVLAGQPQLTEPGVARTIARRLPADARLVVASSMPVRDLEWFGGPTARAHANRGANGIDGVLSTALGLALDGTPTVALVGDIAFVHDAGALIALGARDVDLRIVVVDNDGGGIFSFLPQASELPIERFEQLLGTPHGTDVLALARAHHLDSETVTQPAELVARLGSPGPSVTRVATNRAENVRLHDELHAAVAAALRPDQR